jgi:predicted GIY-YIG superfamily endonuclease
MLYSIYYLKCPTTNKVMYVGMTKDVVKRYYQHFRLNSKNQKKDEWMRSLKEKKLKPLLEVVECGLSKQEAELKEIYYISIYPDLLNIQLGGLMPPSALKRVLTDEQKRQRYTSSVLKKKVIQKTKDGIVVNTFDGVREAFRLTGVDHRSIAQVAGGSKIRKTAGGFLWEYI